MISSGIDPCFDRFVSCVHPFDISFDFFDDVVESSSCCSEAVFVLLLERFNLQQITQK